jgi:hypothetical protein
MITAGMAREGIELTGGSYDDPTFGRASCA